MQQMTVLAKELYIVEISSKNCFPVDESLSKQQKAFLLLRRHLAAINAELQRFDPKNTDPDGTGHGTEDEYELGLVIYRVDSLSAGSEARHAPTTEAPRLKRIPPQNAKHGDVRTYMRRPIVPSCICPEPISHTNSNGPLRFLGHPQPPAQIPRSDFLNNSKSQLNADHYSPENAKRRLMEYLTIV